MSLLSWLVDHNMSMAECARRLTAELRRQGGRKRAVSTETVRRYTLPEGHPAHRKPRPDEMRALYAVTGGAIDANTIYRIEPKGAAGGEGVGPATSAVATAASGAGRPNRALRRRRALQEART